MNLQSKALGRVLKNKTLWLVAILLLLEGFFFYTRTGWTPALMMSKGATPELAGLITSINFWVAIPTVLLVPRLAYKLGVRKPFLWVTSIIEAIFALVAINANLSMSWLLMVLVGAADNTRLVFTLALPVELMPEEDVGTASGLILSIGFIGTIIGPLTGGHILDLTGSLDISLIVLAVVALAAAGIAFRLPETGVKPEG